MSPTLVVLASVGVLKPDTLKLSIGDCVLRPRKPLLATVRYGDVVAPVVEAMTKSGFVWPEVACIERLPHGDVVPIPIFGERSVPAVVIEVVPVCPAANEPVDSAVEDAFAKFAVPEKVGDAEKTTEPVPVSSERSTASAEEDASDDDASFVLKVVQSVAVRRPRVPVEDAFGILKVKTFEEVEIVKSVPMVLVANCWTTAPVAPFTDETPATIPSVVVDTHCVVEPLL